MAMSALFALGLHRRTIPLLLLAAALVGALWVVLPLATGVRHFRITIFWTLTFFVGTALYRGYSGEVTPRTARRAVGAFCAVVGAAILVDFVRYPQPEHSVVEPPAFLLGWVAAYVFFFLLLRLRALRFPRPLLWLGRVSYSIYVVHGLLLQVSLPLPPIAAAATYLAATLAIAALSYRFVEEPAIRMGRQIIARAPDARLAI
jgi:peptidoglycan/LPS O-acetylase OafA/YrhL